MSCYNINRFAHVTFGDMGVCIGLPEDPIENESVYTEIVERATAAGARWIYRNGERMLNDESSEHYGTPSLECRVYGDVGRNPALRNVMLELQNQFGFPDEKWLQAIQKYCR